MLEEKCTEAGRAAALREAASMAARAVAMASAAGVAAAAAAPDADDADVRDWVGDGTLRQAAFGRRAPNWHCFGP